MTAAWDLVHGDAVEVLARLAPGVVDAVITDPPYPEVDRDYGRLSVDEWWHLMRGVVREVRRVLKPRGSAVFVLQPNSERIGRLRPWFFEFLAELAREWNVVQDAWWWNFSIMPQAGANRVNGLLRSSVKACVWAGAPDCYRNQDEVLWDAAESTKALHHAATREGRTFKPYTAPSGIKVDKARIAAAQAERGGVTPFNLLPHSNGNSATSGGAAGHAAATPAKLCSWWVRYITPPGGLVVDPFSGSGTVALEAVRLGREAIGIEAKKEYHEMAHARLKELDDELEASRRVAGAI